MENTIKWLAAGDWVNLTGYIAALLMFSSFYMQKMIPLRIAAIASNIVFLLYTSSSYFLLSRGIWPIFILHAFLLPLNILRMRQMVQLVTKVKDASKGDFAIDFLTPFMKYESYKKGDTLFEKGDESTKLYYIQAGSVKLKEIDVTLGTGELLGEMGIFLTTEGGRPPSYARKTRSF